MIHKKRLKYLEPFCAIDSKGQQGEESSIMTYNITFFVSMPDITKKENNTTRNKNNSQDAQAYFLNQMYAYPPQTKTALQAHKQVSNFLYLINTSRHKTLTVHKQLCINLTDRHTTETTFITEVSHTSRTLLSLPDLAARAHFLYTD